RSRIHAIPSTNPNRHRKSESFPYWEWLQLSHRPSEKQNHKALTPWIGHTECPCCEHLGGCRHFRPSPHNIRFRSLLPENNGGLGKIRFVYRSNKEQKVSSFLLLPIICSIPEIQSHNKLKFLFSHNLYRKLLILFQPAFPKLWLHPVLHGFFHIGPLFRLFCRDIPRYKVYRLSSPAYFRK